MSEDELRAELQAEADRLCALFGFREVDHDPKVERARVLDTMQAQITELYGVPMVCRWDQGDVIICQQAFRLARR